MEGVEVVVAMVVAGDMVGEVDISEGPPDMDFPVDSLDTVDFLVVEDFPVHLLVSVEDLVVEDIVNMRHMAPLEAIVLEDITLATVQEGIMEVATVDIMEAGLEDIPTADITMAADITEAILDITIEDGPHMEQPLDSSTVG